MPHVAMAPLYDAITAACKGKLLHCGAEAADGETDSDLDCFTEGCSQVQMAYEKACFKLDGGSAAISDFPILEVGVRCWRVTSVMSHHCACVRQAHLRGATIQIPPSLYLSKTTSVRALTTLVSSHSDT